MATRKSTNLRIAIVADDLTSATDGAAPFAEAGLRVTVLRRHVTQFHDIDALHCDVLSVDASTRTIDRREALTRVKSITRALATAPILVKQFDSTLRGHVAGECLTMLRASGRKQLIVAPAFPSAGRTTKAGTQYVDGVPVHRTDYASDLLNPVRSSDVRDLFIREGVQASDGPSTSSAVAVLDSETEDDLDQIVKEFVDRTEVLLAGSTGLVRAIARNVGRNSYRRHEPKASSRRTLIVIGSLNDRSRVQAEQLVQRGVALLRMPLGTNPDGLAEEVERTFTAGASEVVLLSQREPAKPDEISRLIVGVTRRLVTSSVVDGLVVTGGETLGAILDALGTTFLKVEAEIEPGVPYCTLGGPFRLPLVSKAGGFGSPDVFEKALRRMDAMRYAAA